MFDSRSAEIYDLIYEQARGRSYREEAEAVLERLAELRPGGVHSLLDVACGTGAHLPHFAERTEVEALDLNPAMVELARRRAPGVPVHRADMSDFDLGRRFDAIVSLFSSIAYVRTVEALNRTLATFAAHLQPGGVVVLEPWYEPDRFLAGTVHAAFVDQPDRKIARFNRSQLIDGRSVVDFHYLIAEPDGVQYFTERHDMALFSRDQMEEAFRRAGLEVSFEPEGLCGRGLYLGRRIAGGEDTEGDPGAAG